MKTLIALSFVMLSFSAFAEGDAERGLGPCREDAKKLCAGVEPGDGRLVKCMKEHEAQVSAECKANLENKKGELREKFGTVIDACKADKEKFCKDVKPGGGAVVNCMKEHRAKLSEACKATLEKGRRPRRKKD